MRRTSILLITLVFLAGAAPAQRSWLDRPVDSNWNNGNGVVPNAPRNAGRIEGICQDQVRQPESIADRAVTRAGWFLFGASQTYGAVTLVTAMADVDGMCRPNNYNAFVFVGNRFAGTLSPTPAGARSDGALGSVHLAGPRRITAEFARYTSQDALCCPSQMSFVEYEISSGARAVVRVADVRTEAVCRDGGVVETQDNVVSGTVTYRQRSALPRTAVLIVKIVDVSRQDVSAIVVAEQRIETAGKQVPISFDIAYDRSRIQQRNTYAIQAEIRDSGRLLFITDTRYPVITQGNPRSVDVTVVPVGGGPGPRGGTIRGSVTFRERIALAANSEVMVKLVDSADSNRTAVAETTFSTGNRQPPYSFELDYEPREINRQRNYELYAEIRIAGRLRFKSDAGQRVELRGNRTDNVELVLTSAPETGEAVTGRTLDLSRLGAGSIKIGDRSTQFLINGRVNVRTDGTAEVTVSSLQGTYRFGGRVTFFDNETVRIAVENSGDADASGEIEVKYSGRNLRSVGGTDLILDGQAVTLRF
ncbi:MAG: YbaY family lipoprotein [Chloracidobacterium sp.]|nr:YbaY family lipoprotein [Chloracidobacterium sp.]